MTTDLKMAAIAQFWQVRRRSTEKPKDEVSLPWKCWLAQLLAWSNGSAGSALFQGYGPERARSGKGALAGPAYEVLRATKRSSGDLTHRWARGLANFEFKPYFSSRQH